MSSTASSRLALLEARISQSIPLQLQANQEMAEEIVRLRAENRQLRCDNAELREGASDALKELRVLREENAILRRLRSNSPVPRTQGGFDDEIRGRSASLRGRSPSDIARQRQAYRHATEYVRENWR
ncbi:hypothetical protein FOZ61_001103 [Perkinsus olseni]|uniref:Uncharacterized protein n=1 Tax=Perkinsus olseni TaxID=32597 RepID=A0A7J6MC67_PEROL|nr:hypothetical protein FOZ61_001103 [Perkinsus olseni]KAF4669149.1 hypothetical protein FOL46_001601 [Perkinsus olseni]